MLSCLGDDAYGIYALASLFAGWCGLLDFGLTTTTSRYITKYYVKNDELGVNETGATAIVLFGGISALVLLFACGAYFFARFFGPRFDDSGLLGAALFFAGASFAVSKISDGVCGVIKGALRQELTGGTCFVFRILFGLVNFGTLFWGGRVIALFVGNLVLTLLQLCIYVVICRHAVPCFRFRLKNFRKKRVRTLFSYSFFAFLAQAGEIAVNRSDLIIIASFLTMGDVTSYNLVVVTLASYFNSFLYETSIWETNWFTRLAALEDAEEGVGERTDEQVKERCSKRLSDEFYASRSTILRVSVYVSFFLAFGVLAFGRPFIERWIGADYLSTFPVLAVYMIAAGLYRGSSETNARLLQGLARHRILAAASVLHGVLNIALSILFVRMGWGLLGVVLGTVLPGVAIHYCWIPNAVCRLVGERKSEYWLRQFKATAASLISLILPALLALKYALPAYWNLFLLAVISAGVYFVSIYFIGLSKRERKKIGSYVARKLRCKET